MKKNRQQRRHPTFPGFPLLYPSGKKTPVPKKTGKPNPKGSKDKKAKYRIGWLTLRSSTFVGLFFNE